MRQHFIELMAPWLALQERWHDAVLLYGAVSVLRRQVSRPPDPLLGAQQAEHLARARDDLPGAEFDAAWAQGVALDAAGAQSQALAMLH